MRWDAQRLAWDDAAALPGLSGPDTAISGLVRSVSPPEFAGITFHEVRARSALNRVPAGPMPFEWTINPYRGCTHACVYCLVPETPVLMADGRVRPIGALSAGDRVIGTTRVGQYRRFVETDVSAAWTSRKPAYQVTLADGTTLVASGDHRFLTARGWKHVTGAMAGVARRPYLTTSDSLMGFGTNPPHPVEDKEYRKGYPALSLLGAAVKSVADLRVVEVRPLGEERPMVDITTGTGDFVANGVISHNCFARGTHEWLELDTGTGFDREVVVKVNVVDVLRRELARPTWARERVAMGTNTDPYQRAEGRYQLMPGIIGALAQSGTPLSILTKGPLIKRDLPLISGAAKDVPAWVGVSIAIMDEALHHSLEPGTPSPRARLDLVRAITDRGLPCRVMLAPVLPWMTDSEDELDRVLGLIAAAGATGASVMALHLKPATKTWFMAWLTRERPDLVRRYEELYRAGPYVPPSYRDALSARATPLLRQYGLLRSANSDPGSDRGRAAGRARPARAKPAEPPVDQQLRLV